MSDAAQASPPGNSLAFPRLQKPHSIRVRRINRVRHSVVAAVLTGSWLAAGCATAPPAVATAQAQAPAQAPRQTEFESLWQAYAATSDGIRLQADCTPQFHRAQASRRGAVLLLHGFGGCPQQFNALAPLLAAAGFDVLVPRLPGHGHALLADGSEDLTAVPTGRDWEPRYGDFVLSMNDMLAASPGLRVLVGFSLGGALAVNAALRAPELYDRLLLLAPLLGIRGGPTVEWLAGTLGGVPGLRNIIVKPAGMRQECAGWRANGRAGFCDYQLRHAAALARLVRQNLAGYSATPLTVPMQIFATGDERYVSNDRITAFARQQSLGGQATLQAMPAGVPHEMLTPYENGGREMFWLDALLQASVRYVADGDVCDGDWDHCLLPAAP